ncbi:MAG TPA: helix-turn-helix domain-containing protein [Nocardioidaceae bacterium]|nr:helix-turn-helix domain-containing protein [Nocardioidaceae bacterium]
MDSPRFLTPADVAEVLNTSVAQVMALIHKGDLEYIQIGGRKQYRIENVDVEAYIARQKSKARAEREARSEASTQ